VDRSIAQGTARTAGAPLVPADRAARLTVLVGLGVALAMLVLYVLTRPSWQNLYDHFVWQAAAWLEGQAHIRYPVEATATSRGNAWLHDVVPLVGPDGLSTGRALIPFPPLPAILLAPLVAVYGLATDQVLVSAVVGAFDVALAFWVLGRLPIRPSVRILATIFIGAGTVLWYAASIGTTWYFAHVVALAPALAAIGLALEADGDAGRRPGVDTAWLDGRQVVAGFLLGLAATARLTVIFGLPFLFLVGGGGTWRRRAAAATLGAAIPVLALVAYTLATTGEPFNPAYEVLYRNEVEAYPQFGYNGAWGATDLRYIPQNLLIALFAFPQVMPACDAGVVREIWSAAGCGYLVPRDIGTSLLLTSPAYLLALAALPRIGRDRVVAGAALATAAIAIVNLAHFSQGWVQFGYRFSLDFAPFLLLLVALGTEVLLATRWRRAWAAVAVGLVAVSIIVQGWGIGWARALGW
jgi:hypothetical protein